jgi:hypothetical protein
MVAGQSWHPLTQGQRRAEIHQRIKRAFVKEAGQSWHPLTQSEDRRQLTPDCSVFPQVSRLTPPA